MQMRDRTLSIGSPFAFLLSIHTRREIMASAEERIGPFDAARDRRIGDRRVVPRSVTRVELAPAMSRIAWSGVWGGFLIALGIWLTLATLGTAVGLSNIGPGSNMTATTMTKASGAWLYLSGLVGLFFGGVFGTRLSMTVDGAIAWLEATLIWTFALILTTGLATGLVSLAAAHPAATQAIVQSNPAVTNPGAITAGAWLSFIGIVVAWVVTVLGSFWGRAQARGRAQALGLAA
jgi:hypothetical protein